MDILETLSIRGKYAIGAGVNDELLEQLVKSDAEEIAIVLTDNIINQRRLKKDSSVALLDEKYHLKAMFDLKNPYMNTHINFLLYVFSKSECRTIQYGIYKNVLHNKLVKCDGLSLPDEYPEEYFAYLEAIEDYLSNGICPSDTITYEFGVIESTERKNDCWNPKPFNKEAVKIKEALKSEKTLLLSEIADIICPFEDTRQEYGTIAIPSNWRYPTDYKKLTHGKKTNTPLMKGDIVLQNVENMFLVYEEPQTELHTSRFCFIIRPKGISSEYLLSYLKSETAKTIVESTLVGSFFRRIKRKDIEALPIVLPQKDQEYYRNIFYLNNFPVSDLSRYNVTIQGLLTAQDASTIEDILDVELIRQLRVTQSEVKERILEEDLRELNICFKNRAYKATLILAGSILEAVLIDWLSELHHKNYFEEEYIDYNGNKGTLAIYIRDIKYLKRPGWIEEADKAHLIKDKRNQVHAKLCLKSDEINEDLCRQVVGYLSDVLKTRNGRRVVRR